MYVYSIAFKLYIVQSLAPLAESLIRFFLLRKIRVKMKVRK